MAKRKTDKEEASFLPALSPEAREDQLISLAQDLAEKKLRDGTASSQLISYYLRLGSTRERLEKQNLVEDLTLKRAKTEQLKSAKRVEELYSRALDAMRLYSGRDEDEEDIYD